MESPDVARAIEAAISIAVALDLPADHATVLQNSNKLALRLLPCNVFARVAPVAHDHARFEVELAQRLAEAGSPVAALEPRVEPRGYRRDGFEITLWTYYESATAELSPAVYADALERLHAGMRTLDVATPHFTDRVAQAERLVSSRDLTPELPEADRDLLTSTLRQLRRVIIDHGAVEQLLHGEPHPGNVLSTENGPVFIDLETGCRGPVEFDLAHVPETVSEHYPGVDHTLLGDCRQLVLAMVAAWRWEPDDQLPNGQQFGRRLLSVLRAGPPWPTLDGVFGRPDARRGDVNRATVQELGFELGARAEAGVTDETWFATAPDGAPVVLKWFPDEAVAERYAILLPALDELRQRGVPVPAYPYVLGGDGWTLSAQQILPGTSVRNPSPAIVERMVECVAAMVGVVCPLQPPGGPTWGASVVHTLTVGVAGWAMHEPMRTGGRRSAAVLDRVKAIGADADPAWFPSDGIVHLDLHTDNVLVDHDDTLTGIIDWEGACGGDPRFDLVRFAYDLDGHDQPVWDVVEATGIEPHVLRAYVAHDALVCTSWQIHRHTDDVLRQLDRAERVLDRYEA